MTTVLIVIHVIVSIFLIAVVLLQRGRGAEIGAVFGGGASSTVFGSRGAGNFLTKLTTISAVLFMATSLGLSYIFTRASGERLFDAPIEAEAPGTETPPVFEELGQVPAPAETAQPEAGALPALPPPGAADAP
jgi:preprotein translocase subunit SecG